MKDPTKNDPAPANLKESPECERQSCSELDELEKLKALEAKVPSVEDLKLIAIDPREWLSEPGWPD